MSKLYVYTVIGLLTVLMGLGALWQHNRYVSLTKQYEVLVEANKGLEEASKRDKEVSDVKDTSFKEKERIVQDNTKKVNTKVERLEKIAQEGTKDEKTVMATPLPDSVVSVLDSAFEGRD